MLDFITSNAKDFLYFGQKMWQETWRFNSPEKTSQHIAQQLYQAFVSPLGEPSLELVQIYQLTGVGEKHRSLRQTSEWGVVDLLGSYGLVPERQSYAPFSDNQTMTFNQEELLRLLPMLPSILTQLQVDQAHFYETGSLLSARNHKGTFHIPALSIEKTIHGQHYSKQAHCSRTLLGFGGLTSYCNELYLLCAMAQEPVAEKQAKKFFLMQNFTGAALSAMHHHAQVLTV